MNLPPRMLPKVAVAEMVSVETDASKRLLEIWERARESKFAPALGKDFNVDDIPYDIIPCVSIVDVVDGGCDYFYRYWGTKHVEVKGMELSGKMMSEGPLPQVIEYGYKQFAEVLQRRKPTAFIYVGPYQSAVHRQQTTFRFPLSGDGQNVDGILSYQDLDNQVGEWSAFFETQWGGQIPDRALLKKN